MILTLTALNLLRTVSLVQTVENPQRISVREVHVGENVTLQCQILNRTKTIHWLKQSLGYMVQTMATFDSDKWSLGEPFDKDTHFQIVKGNDQHLLTIINVSKEDEATYFCHHGTAFSSTFFNGTRLAIKDCCTGKTVKVKQSPETTEVQLGDSVSLQCSLSCHSKETSIQCPDENSVYWFRALSEGVNLGITDNPKSRSVKKEEKSCIYSLSKTIQSSSDAGTYYCAVFSCGEILFGQGTSVKTSSELNPLILTLGVLLACCVAVNCVLICFIKRRRVCDQCKAEMTSNHAGCDQSAVDQSRDVDEPQALTYAALDFPGRRAKRGINKKREAPQESAYSAIRTGPVSLGSNSQWVA